MRKLRYAPTNVLEIDEAYSVAPKIAIDKNLQNRSLRGFEVKPVDDYLKSRVPVLVNNDCHISLAAPKINNTERRNPTIIAKAYCLKK